MKVQLKLSEDGVSNGTKVIQHNEDGSETELMNVKRAVLVLEVDEMQRLTLDLVSPVSCHHTVEAVARIRTKQGEMKQVKRVEYEDGTVDEYT